MHPLTDLGRSAKGTKRAPNPRDPLYFETATTLPVDFHSFRRAFNTALAGAGVNVQQAMHLAGHSDAKTHMRYVMQSPAMRAIPPAALPKFPASLVRIVTGRDVSNGREIKTSMNPARPLGLEPTTRGLEEASEAAQDESLCGVASREGVDGADRDSACFSARQDDSSPNVTGGARPDPIELALARALERAAEAGRFDVVEQLAKELEARRVGRGRGT